MIRHTTARRIASAWHGGMMTGLYALASSGAIVTTFSCLTPDPDDDQTPIAAYEIRDCLEQNVRYPRHLTPNERRELESLRAYVRHEGPRGPAPGWSKRGW